MELQMDEKHLVDLSNLQSSMALSFKEELQQVNMDFLMPFLGFFKKNNQISASVRIFSFPYIFFFELPAFLAIVCIDIPSVFLL